jgi:hypothetical protein
MPPKAGTVFEVADMGLDLFGILSNLSRFFNKTPEVAQAVTGKTKDQQSEDMVRSWGLGLTLADEMRLVTDVCWLINGEKITYQQGYDFLDYLRNQSVRTRTRFREGYVKEKHHLHRVAVLEVLATKITDWKARTNFIAGAGFLDLSSGENLQADLEAPVSRVAEWARDEERLSELRKLREDRQNAATARAVARKDRGSVNWVSSLVELFRFRFGRRK